MKKYICFGNDIIPYYFSGDYIVIDAVSGNTCIYKANTNDIEATLVAVISKNISVAEDN